ncbi:hypothetical protein EDD37DRAFT_444756 [Exophiala viscosa]|uniref:Uncharacterized protein n=1 Tax=Exophiala viscosa TaxID=2486360 RepID=A0AAN6DW16_9EURO|nr:hypothetical protein EDD36DRAFT_281776 [Exophiala viscosa]KAI1622846.1 hypothetical protein EDD37DRAFT_444756 [Exophiala viscosa]
MAQQKADSHQSNDQADDARENGNPLQVTSEMAKAFQELAHGERTASALESKLDDIESRIEQLLATMENSTQDHGQNSTPSQSK